MTLEERRAKAAARKQAERERLAQQQRDREIVAQAMREILTNETASIREKIFASLTINHITMGYILPLNAVTLYDRYAVDTIPKEEPEPSSNV